MTKHDVNVRAEATLHPGDSRDIHGTAEVKVANNASAQGKVRVKCPNVPSVDYDVAAHGSRNIQIPVGDSRFTNAGATDLALSW